MVKLIACKTYSAYVTGLRKLGFASEADLMAMVAFVFGYN